jgi:hypothetical protein
MDIDCMEMVFHLSVFSSVSSNLLFLRKSWDIDCKEMDFHLSVFKCVFKLDVTENVLGH